MPLDFNILRETSRIRCDTAFRPLMDWSPCDYATALAGEVGEVCNEIKKMRRIAETPEALAEGRHDPALWAEPDHAYAARVKNVAWELADVVIYADLLAQRLGIDLGEAVVEKFNETSEKVGSPIRLPQTPAAKPLPPAPPSQPITS